MALPINQPVYAQQQQQQELQVVVVVQQPVYVQQQQVFVQHLYFQHPIYGPPPAYQQSLQQPPGYGQQFYGQQQPMYSAFGQRPPLPYIQQRPWHPAYSSVSYGHQQPIYPPLPYGQQQPWYGQPPVYPQQPAYLQQPVASRQRSPVSQLIDRQAKQRLKIKEKDAPVARRQLDGEDNAAEALPRSLNATTLAPAVSATAPAVPAIASTEDTAPGSLEQQQWQPLTARALQLHSQNVTSPEAEAEPERTITPALDSVQSGHSEHGDLAIPAQRPVKRKQPSHDTLKVPAQGFIIRECSELLSSPAPFKPKASLPTSRLPHLHSSPALLKPKAKFKLSVSTTPHLLSSPALLKPKVSLQTSRMPHLLSHPALPSPKAKLSASRTRHRLHLR